MKSTNKGTSAWRIVLFSLFVGLMAMSASASFDNNLRFDDSFSSSSFDDDLRRGRDWDRDRWDDRWDDRRDRWDDDRRGGWEVRWVDYHTGQNISGWQHSDRPVCGHGSSCNCRGQNYCGEYSDYQTAKYWDRGCHRRARTIVCEARRTHRGRF